MSSKRLPTRSLLDLIDLFERSIQSISDLEGQRLQGVPGWDVIGRTSLTAPDIGEWTECIGYAGHYPAPCDGDRMQVELTEGDDSARYQYRCPETFRKKYVPAEMVTIYAVSRDRLLNMIADLLEVPQVLRSGIERPAIQGVLWHLGKARIGPAMVDIWFTRALAETVDQVFRHFQSTAVPEQGLILTSGAPLPTFVRPPRSYRFATMQQVLVDYVPQPCIDMTLLHRILSLPADGVLPPVMAVHFDEVGNVLTIRTKKKPWPIKGVRQAAAVRYMYEQAQLDRWLLDAGEILTAAYPDKQVGKSQRMQNIFSGNEEWKEYICNPQKGKYCFCLD
ncbi:hypothetical protein [Halothiobacillus sp.]|uniref:hypothetical protein n=1 Tax=Halothiobacillus sp. TaxID=1891311 RepID=UPI0026057ED7|nr:hypothetical protein [Halothiobacillus sp.]